MDIDELKDINQLKDMVAEGAALRRRQRLQPVGGQGDKIFPPTYPGEGRNAPPRHVYERRRLDGQDVWCVLIDSVQSQANRLEECLLEAIHDGLSIPYVEVNFSNAQLDGITRITSLDAPHRVYDAILRDSLLENERFMESAVGQRLAKASAEDASALLEISPTALLFGAWHSTGQGGGLGAKFARCLVSEIMGINVPVEFTEQRQSPTAYLAQAGERIFTVEPVTSARRPSSRIDPLGASNKVKIYRSADDKNDWTADIDKAARDEKGDPILFSRKKGDKAGKPSIINHGNIKPSLQPLGITCDYAEHAFVLSFAALRRLRFGGPEKDAAGRSLLAALGLVALTEQDTRGYALRSRCDLVCDRSSEKDKRADEACDSACHSDGASAPPEKDKSSDEACDGRTWLELVRPNGTTKNIEIDNETARMLYKEAFEAAKTAEFNMPAEPLRLTPQPKLVEIVRRSQQLALSGEGGKEEEASGDE